MSWIVGLIILDMVAVGWWIYQFGVIGLCIRLIRALGGGYYSREENARSDTDWRTRRFGPWIPGPDGRPIYLNQTHDHRDAP